MHIRNTNLDETHQFDDDQHHATIKKEVQMPSSRTTFNIRCRLMQTRTQGSVYGPPYLHDLMFSMYYDKYCGCISFFCIHIHTHTTIFPFSFNFLLYKIASLQLLDLYKNILILLDEWKSKYMIFSSYKSKYYIVCTCYYYDVYVNKIRFCNVFLSFF